MRSTGRGSEIGIVGRLWLMERRVCRCRVKGLSYSAQHGSNPLAIDKVRVVRVMDRMIRQIRINRIME